MKKMTRVLALPAGSNLIPFGAMPSANVNAPPSMQRTWGKAKPFSTEVEMIASRLSADSKSLAASSTNPSSASFWHISASTVSRSEPFRAGIISVSAENRSMPTLGGSLRRGDLRVLRALDAR